MPRGYRPNCGFGGWVSRVSNPGILWPNYGAAEALELLSSMVDAGIAERGPLSPLGEPTFVLDEAAYEFFISRWREGLWGGN